MPELPEVENILKSLREIVLNKCIERVDNLRQDFCPHADKLGELKGSTITALKRRGKWLLVELNDPNAILLHLGMSGRFILLKADNPNPKYALFRFIFEDGNALVYCDMRRFGRFELVPKNKIFSCKPLSFLGVEPLAEDFNVALLSEILSKSKRQIKDFLLDQRKVAGLGNIYVCEILFDSRINPYKAANKLNAEEIELLYKSIQKVLKQAIIDGGSTINSYINPTGKEGSFQLKHQVYGRQDKPCNLCSTIIRREKQHGRSTYFCPQCQPL